jgi:lysozyme family protein
MNFDDAFAKLLGHEGGYSNHPADPGGETNWGITVAVARANGYAGPMKDMPLDVAKRIYRACYWDAVAAEALPPAVRYVVFDAAVNSGVAQAVRWLQRAVYAQPDGVLGPKTLMATNAADPQALKASFLGQRLRFMTDLPTWGAFGRGWARRIAVLMGEGG